MNSFFELIKTRRSIRKYTDEKIDAEKISLITKTALMSPSSKKSNPWEFIVVQNAQMLEKLANCKTNSSQFLAHAPLGIVVIADTTKSDIWIEDASIASIIIQLQAHDLGLGSCWIQVYNRKKNEQTSAENYIKDLLQIPEQYSVLCIISIGYPNEVRKPYEEEKLQYEKIHNEKF